MFTVVTDYLSDLTPSILEKYRIVQIPHPSIDSAHKPGGAGGESRSFRQNRRAVNPYIQMCEPILERGQDILFIGVSSEISEAYCSALRALSKLKNRWQERQITLFDSKSFSLGEGFLAVYAAECRDRGFGLQETVRRLKLRRRRIYQIAAASDLFYFKRNPEAFAAPDEIHAENTYCSLVKVDPNGAVEFEEKTYGKMNAVNILTKKYEKLCMYPEIQTVGIVHADMPDCASILSKMISKKKPPKEILMVRINPISGGHIGSDMIGLFFLGDDFVRYC